MFVLVFFLNKNKLLCLFQFEAQLCQFEAYIRKIRYITENKENIVGVNTIVIERERLYKDIIINIH